MPIVLREQDQVARHDLDLLAPFSQPHDARALREEVEQHDMFGARETFLHAGHSVPSAHAPGRGELRVEEERAFELDGLEHV